MQKNLKQKHIEQFLWDIEDFQFGEIKKIKLEQHMTPARIAAQILYHIYRQQPIQSAIVADLGVGTGMLSCGLIYIGAMYLIGYQIDSKYLQIAQQLLHEKVQGANYDFVIADMRQQRTPRQKFDLIVMNPPFGTKVTGIDIIFLEWAMKSCHGNIYSMHKTSTRNFIRKFCQQRNYKFEVLDEVKFPLPKRFNKYHKSEIKYTEVDLILIRPIKK